MEKTEKIGGRINSTTRAVLAKQLRHEKKCSCGRMIEPVIFPGGTPVFAPSCRKCETLKRQTALRRNTRQRREDKILPMRTALSVNLPPKFQTAKLCQLPEALRNALLKVPSDCGIYLWGRVGVGKTHAMSALIRKWIVEGDEVKRVPFERLCRRIRATFRNSSSECEDDIIEELSTADKLLIEDIGVSCTNGQETDFGRRVLHSVLDARIEELLPTYFTSNYPVEKIGEIFDVRIESRIHESCEVIQLRGMDRRRKK